MPRRNKNILGNWLCASQLREGDEAVFDTYCWSERRLAEIVRVISTHDNGGELLLKLELRPGREPFTAWRPQSLELRKSGDMIREPCFLLTHRKQNAWSSTQLLGEAVVAKLREKGFIADDFGDFVEVRQTLERPPRTLARRRK